MKNLNCSNKKGNLILDSALILIILVALIFVSVIIYKPVTEMNDEIQNDPITWDQNTRETSQMITTSYPSLFDKLFLFAFILLWILAMISGAFIQSHPAFFAISVILLILLTTVMFFISDGLGDLTEDTDLSFNSFPIATWIINHLGIISLILSLSIGVSLYLGGRSG